MLETGLTGRVLRVVGHRLIVHVEERTQSQDLNGDGDIDDQVFHVVDAATGDVKNTAVAATSHRLAGNRLVSPSVKNIRVGPQRRRRSAGLRSHVHDLETGLTRNLGFAGSIEAEGHETVDATIATVLEGGDTGPDLNGDGDRLDRVLHVYDFRSGTLHQPRHLGDSPR